MQAPSSQSGEGRARRPSHTLTYIGHSRCFLCINRLARLVLLTPSTRQTSPDPPVCLTEGQSEEGRHGRKEEDGRHGRKEEEGRKEMRSEEKGM